MGTHADQLKSSTDTLLRDVIRAAAAEIAADAARTEQAPNLFALAQAHRAAHKQAQDSTAACIAAAKACIVNGEMTLRAAEDVAT